MKQSSVFRIDEKVAYSMIAISILAIIMLAFKFATRSKDLQVNIAHDDSVFINSQANFRVIGAKGKTCEWNFGDSSIESYTDTSVMHKYKKAGTYFVSVTVDGQNKEMIKQDVYGVAEVVTTPAPEIKISFPEPSYINDQVSFSVNLPKNVSVEWYFEGSSQPSSTSTTVTKSFSTKGYKKIELKINPKTKEEKTVLANVNILEKEVSPVIDNNPANQGNGGKGKKVQVPAAPISPGLTPSSGNKTANTQPDQPKPDAPKPKPVTKAPFELTQEPLTKMLIQIKTDGLAISAFQSFFCDNPDITVTVENKSMKFSELYKKISELSKDKKAKKIKVTNIVQNSETHCIQTFTVNM